MIMSGPLMACIIAHPRGKHMHAFDRANLGSLGSIDIMDTAVLWKTKV